jgi:hypothetical protein
LPRGTRGTVPTAYLPARRSQVAPRKIDLFRKSRDMSLSRRLPYM